MGNAKKKIVFSSGFAYGTLPKMDESFDIICVRGPLTANILKIDQALAITDGAALLRYFNFPRPAKKYAHTFIPHLGSEDFFDWRKLCEEAGIHYLSPRGEVDDVLKVIMQSEVVIAEAMHGAIVADVLRVPWIPVKAYSTINNFKWNDWAKSLSLNYRPLTLKSLYTKEFMQTILSSKLGGKIPKMLTSAGASLYSLIRKNNFENNALNDLKKIKNAKSYLSDETIFNSKSDQLLEKLEVFKNKYPKK
jgi:succinoglycan biosynthesis protein ExoV